MQTTLAGLQKLIQACGLMWPGRSGTKVGLTDLSVPKKEKTTVGDVEASLRTMVKRSEGYEAKGNADTAR
ncbi:hypothetical protein QVD17_22859 [Tagetes erecta]|uniref:Uncharacterized protein n=1 Tax=Tagetes erecta TaxID=13708 RepID=A0AAD8KDS6_TARER|nr:hypothetical protein QVD17_22859 [Tagetes erecta]